MKDFFSIVIGMFIICQLLALALRFITFGLIPNEAIFSIGCILFVIISVILILDKLLKLLGFNGIFVVSEETMIKIEKQEKEKYRKENKLKIKKQLDDIRDEFDITKDVINLTSPLTFQEYLKYMDNDEKYPYIIEQERKIKELFEENKDLFKITENGIFIKENFYEFKPDEDCYSKEDLDLLREVFLVEIEDVNKMIKRRHNALELVRECLNKVTLEAMTTAKGKKGEDNVYNSLKLYTDNYFILKNIRVELKGESSESDFIIVCDKGLFAIEVKNHGNENGTIEVAQDGQWSMIYNGRKTIKDSVSAQNNRHCAINQNLLNRKLKEKGIDTEYIKCKSIIVIANEKVGINNKSMNIVVRPSEIITYIENMNTETTLNKELQLEIANIFNELCLPPKKYPVNDWYANFESAIYNYKTLTRVLTGYKQIYNTYYKYI